MGGMYGPEYAGKMTINADGLHGVAVCEDPAEARYRLVCAMGHESGEVMPLCRRHAAMIQGRMADTCTRCVWPAEAQEVNEQINRVQTEITRTRDRASAMRLRDRAEELGRKMDELIARGVIVKRPMRLVEVS
jgi:hypothetical protein